MINRIIVIILLTLQLLGCNLGSNSIPKYCKSLKTKISEPYISEKIIDWYDENFKNQLIKEGEDYFYGGSYVPGSYTYMKPFDWSVLNFNERNAKVKLVKINEKENDSLVYASVSSISIAERSRVSILVQRSKNEYFGFDSSNQFIDKISDRLAIYCLDVDD